MSLLFFFRSKNSVAVGDIANISEDHMWFGTSIVELSAWNKHFHWVGAVWEEWHWFVSNAPLFLAGNRIEWKRKIMQFIINLDLTNCSLVPSFALFLFSTFGWHWYFEVAFCFQFIHTHTISTQFWNKQVKSNQQNTRTKNNNERDGERVNESNLVTPLSAHIGCISCVVSGQM